jgi:hypothetical protein
METTEKQGRGRPRKPDALTNAERQRRYREACKESGKVNRYVTKNQIESGGYKQDLHLRVVQLEKLVDKYESDLYDEQAHSAKLQSEIRTLQKLNEYLAQRVDLTEIIETYEKNQRGKIPAARKAKGKAA